MISQARNFDTNQFQLKSNKAAILRVAHICFETLQKVCNIANKIFYPLAITLTLLSGAHLLASISYPLSYFTWSNLGLEIGAFFCFIASNLASRIEKLATFCIDKLFHRYTYYDLLDPVKLWKSEHHLLPKEVELLVLEYKRDCLPHEQQVHREIKGLADDNEIRSVLSKYKSKITIPKENLGKSPDFRGLESQPTKYRNTAFMPVSNEDKSKLKHYLLPIEKTFFEKIQGLHHQFFTKLVEKYAYPKYLEYAKKNRLNILDKMQYGIALQNALSGLKETNTLVTFQEIVENPGSIKKQLDFFFSKV